MPKLVPFVRRHRSAQGFRPCSRCGRHRLVFIMSLEPAPRINRRPDRPEGIPPRSRMMDRETGQEFSRRDSREKAAFREARLPAGTEWAGLPGAFGALFGARPRLDFP